MKSAMVIDDSKAMRAILSRTLSNLGFESCTAQNGLEALQVIRNKAPSLQVILVDWNMPEMNGLDFVRALRAEPGYGGIPLMMVTTETEMEQMITALDAGVDEYLMKPFTEESVADKLRLLGVLS